MLCSDGFSVAFESGVLVLEILGTGLPHAEIAKRTAPTISQSFREDVMLVGHHRDGSKDQEKEEKDEEPEEASFGVQFGDVIQRRRTNIAQPKQNEYPEQPTQIECSDGES